MKIPKREFTAEFRELAVKRVKGSQGVGAVARELGISEQTVRNWVKAFDAGKLEEAKALPEKPQKKAQDWLSKIKARYTIETALADSGLVLVQTTSSPVVVAQAIQRDFQRIRPVAGANLRRTRGPASYCSRCAHACLAAQSNFADR
mgnify:CR=1 FL=1